MAENLKPRDAAEVEQAVKWAIAGGKTLEIVGRGSKRLIGRAAQWDMTLDISGLSGVTLYEPAELVLSAKAGTPLSEIETLLTANGQQLAFEPMDYGPLLGGAAGSATIGGVLSSNLSGPRRIKAGAARDHFLGVTAVSGRGEIFKSGGRVVKNVTGYDLCKLLAGSWGTLAAMTDVTVKTLPRAETERTVLVLGLGDAAAGKLMTAVMGSFADASAAAHLSSPLAERHCRDCDRGRGGDGPSARRRRPLGGASPSRAGRAGEVLRPPGLRSKRLCHGHSGAQSATRLPSPPRGRLARAMSGAFRRRPRVASKSAARWSNRPKQRCSTIGPVA